MPYRSPVALLLLTAFVGIPRPTQAQGLAVANAGSLARPFRELLDSFSVAHPDLSVSQQNGGSLELARQVHDLGRAPDVFATADVDVVTQVLLSGGDVAWYVPFARNSMVLAYGPRSEGASEINGDNWWQIVTGPGVRMGASDPAVDPNGYRTLLVFQLAERFYASKGLAARLRAATPAEYQRPNETDLLALVQAGELDYAWSYRSVAITAGLRYVELPPEIDLSDPRYAGFYGSAAVRVRGKTPFDSLDLAGAPILYGLTVPASAPHPAAAVQFVNLLFSPTGRAILSRNGLIPLEHPRVVGIAPAGLRIR